MKNGDRIRLNLAVTEAVRDRLEGLLERTEAESLTEVVRRALAAYECLIKAQHNGEKIWIEKANGECEVWRLL